jgi:hypothetical protein
MRADIINGISDFFRKRCAALYLFIESISIVIERNHLLIPEQKVNLEKYQILENAPDLKKC